MTIIARITMAGQPTVRVAIDDRKHPHAGFGIIAAIAALMNPDACQIREALYVATDDIEDTNNDKSRGNKNVSAR